MLLLQRIVGVEAERNFYESQLIILDTLEKVLNSVRILQILSLCNDFVLSGHMSCVGCSH